MCHISSSIQPNFFEREIRSVRLKGYVTSMGLEEEFWTVLKGLAKDENMPISRLLAQLYEEYVTQTSNSSNFASFLRVSCVEIVRSRQSSAAQSGPRPHGSSAARSHLDDDASAGPPRAAGARL